MASIEKRPDGKFRARWREYPNGPQRTKSFDRKIDARQFVVDVEHRLMSGTYVPPKAGMITLADYSVEWLARRSWAQSTEDKIGVDLRLHILPSLGRRPLASLRRAHIEEWAKGLPLSAQTVAGTFQTLAMMLASAVDDHRIARNPATGADLPKITTGPVVPMAVEDVRALAAGCVERQRAAVVTAAGTGLRQGELFAVTVDRIDFVRRTLRVDRQLWTPRDGPPRFAPPKTRNSYRTIALSSLVADTLSAHLDAYGPGSEGHVFTIAAGRPVNRTKGSVIIREARKAAGLGPVTWHDLRHHHASVLLSKGVSPAYVAERLGHSIGTLLRTYAHVIRSDEDRVRAIIDASLGGSSEDWLRTAVPSSDAQHGVLAGQSPNIRACRPRPPTWRRTATRRRRHAPGPGARRRPDARRPSPAPAAPLPRSGSSPTPRSGWRRAHHPSS